MRLEARGGYFSLSGAMMISSVVKLYYTGTTFWRAETTALLTETL